MIKRRNIAWVLLALLLSICLVGCGDSPEATVEEFLNYLRNFDLEKADSLVLSDDEPGSVSLSESIGSSEGFSEDGWSEFQDFAKSSLKMMDYSVTNVTTEEDGTKATVNVDIKSVDLSDLTKEGYKKILNDNLTAIRNKEISQIELIEMLMENIISKAQDSEFNASEHMKSSPVTFPLIMTDNGWRIEKVPDEMGEIFSMGLNVLRDRDVMEEILVDFIKDYKEQESSHYGDETYSDGKQDNDTNAETYLFSDSQLNLINNLSEESITADIVKSNSKNYVNSIENIGRLSYYGKNGSQSSFFYKVSYQSEGDVIDTYYQILFDEIFGNMSDNELRSSRRSSRSCYSVNDLLLRAMNLCTYYDKFYVSLDDDYYSYEDFLLEKYQNLISENAEDAEKNVLRMIDYCPDEIGTSVPSKASEYGDAIFVNDFAMIDKKFYSSLNNLAQTVLVGTPFVGYKDDMHFYMDYDYEYQSEVTFLSDSGEIDSNLIYHIASVKEITPIGAILLIAKDVNNINDFANRLYIVNKYEVQITRSFGEYDGVVQFYGCNAFDNIFILPGQIFEVDRIPKLGSLEKSSSDIRELINMICNSNIDKYDYAYTSNIQKLLEGAEISELDNHAVGKEDRTFGDSGNDVEESNNTGSAKNSLNDDNEPLLEAYQKYIDSAGEMFYEPKFLFAYIDRDDIPELLVASENEEHILQYQNGEVIDVGGGMAGMHFYYKPKKLDFVDVASDGETGYITYYTELNLLTEDMESNYNLESHGDLYEEEVKTIEAEYEDAGDYNMYDSLDEAYKNLK